MLVGQDLVLSLRSMFLLIDCIFTSWFRLFHNHQHQYFFPFFNKRRIINILLDWNKVFNKKVIYFPLFILIVFLFVNQMHIFLNMKCFDGVCYGGNCFVFVMKKYVSIWSIRFILNFTSFGSILNWFEYFSIMYNPFVK